MEMEQMKRDVELRPKNLILDVDGVLTDGKYQYTTAGKVSKIFGPDDNDALSLLKKYMNIHVVSGDKRGFEITKKRIDDMKLPIDLVSVSDRVSWIAKKFNPKETIYMGDGIFDAAVFDKVAYGIAPANAFYTTKARADFVTASKGGDSAVAEAVLHILEKFFQPFDPINFKIAKTDVKKIAIPSKSLKYILYQRTGYLKDNLIFRLLTRLGEFKFLYKTSVKIKCWLFGSKIEKLFAEDMMDEYFTIKHHLPEKANSILGIGPGVAAIDALIGNHYSNNINVFLIDKTKIDKNVYYKFNKQGSFYNSLSISKELLALNGINSVHLQEATDDNRINFNNEFDLVTSLISWGFHYPIETYLSQVHQRLKPGGILIVDVRKNTQGEDAIKRQFGNIRIIFESGKFNRVLARKVAENIL